MTDILFYVTDKEDFTTEEIISHFGYAETSAKRYLRQLAEFGYLEAHGGNKNRRYSCLKTLSVRSDLQSDRNEHWHFRCGKKTRNK